MVIWLAQLKYMIKLFWFFSCQNIQLIGYYISYKYFWDYKLELQERLQFTNHIRIGVLARKENLLFNYYKKHGNSSFNSDNTVLIAIHARRGDIAVKDPQSHGYTVATMEYFLKAMDHFRCWIETVF